MSSNGGSNGCIDFQNSDHNGLQDIIAQLDSSRAPFASIISRADYWVLAATLAIRFASTPSANGVPPNLPRPPAPLDLPFKFGRVTDASCAGLDAGRLPGAGFSWAQSQEMFGAKGLTVSEIVALFGAHALGRAEFRNSGFEGGWTRTQSSFAPTYFTAQLGIPWRNANITSNSHLWLNSPANLPSIILLKSDAELSISPTEPGCPVFGPPPPGAPPPPPGSCPLNPATNNIKNGFGTNIQSWYTAFASGWAKMVEFGYTGSSALSTPRTSKATGHGTEKAIVDLPHTIPAPSEQADGAKSLAWIYAAGAAGILFSAMSVVLLVRHRRNKTERVTTHVVV